MYSVSDKETLLSFNGHLEYETIGELINKLKDGTKGLNLNLTTYKKLLSATIEVLENIYKYHEFFENEISFTDKFAPSFIIEKTSTAFILNAANPILKDDVETLKERINIINELNEVELKELYKSTITNGQFSSKGGAGLGFMEMAKLSDDKLEFDFENINEKFSYFILALRINLE